MESKAMRAVSHYYEEGYEQGYNDGEEAAYTHSGWQATYDDDCDYRGWKQSDYEEGTRTVTKPAATTTLKEKKTKVLQGSSHLVGLGKPKDAQN